MDNIQTLLYGDDEQRLNYFRLLRKHEKYILSSPIEYEKKIKRRNLVTAIDEIATMIICIAIFIYIIM